MSDPVALLEKALAAYTGRRHCVATGRGAAAIYLALRAMPRRGGKVVLPAMLCPSPANVVLYAGFEPIFCDVRSGDLTMDVASLEAVVAAHPDCVAVLPVHLYGAPADLEAITQFARAKGLFVIEDAAQAFGGTYQGKRLGAFGDVSVLSFGHTKILDAGGGGALLTDDGALAARLREGAAGLPARPADLEARSAEYRHVYYTLKGLTDRDPRLHELFVPLPGIYRDLYLFGLETNQAEAILARLPQLEAVVAARRERARVYRSLLRHPEITHLTPNAGEVPWRYTVLLPAGRRERVVDGLRATGVDVSTWYPPLHRWYRAGRGQDPAYVRNAAATEARVLNLWTDPSVALDTVANTSQLVLQLLDGGNAHGPD